MSVCTEIQIRVKVNDISINYEVTGNGKTLVLIHGVGGNAQAWETTVPLLSRYHRVLTWDVRGHGQSDKPEGSYSTELFASDLAALLRTVDIGSAFVLGHSMGGVIAIRFALDFPDLCNTLIVSSSSAEVNSQSTKYWQGMATNVLEKGIEAIPFDPTRTFSKSFVERNPEVVEELARNRLANDPSCYARAAIAMSEYNYNEELGRIRCPTLIIVGDQDVMTPPGGSVRMSRLIPNSKLIIFKDCGHVSYVEQPEVFSRAVLDFLTEVNT
ncbi:alpha/beta fold hydrolase [Chloroflexota bacterium]